ncbi:MAG: sugar phosphate isomerase/epimerase family protein [Bacteroidales bacterium]
MKRRQFIGAVGTAAVATSLMPLLSCRSRVPATGLILYTVRDAMADDVAGTLERIAEIGYNWIEAADYRNGLFYGMQPARFAGIVESVGMSLISSHNGMNSENYESIIDDCAAAGMKYVIIPSLPDSAFNSADSLKQAADFFNIVGERASSAGLKAGFHNHQTELRAVDGIIPLDHFIENTDPGNFCFEMDVAWLSAEGASPVEYFNRYPGRFELLHIKDLTADKTDATLGEGTLDFVPIFSAVKKAGMKYFFVEQDNCITHTPIESVEISRQFLMDNIL